jgi:5-deoxy-D-glucuronate isomerase
LADADETCLLTVHERVTNDVNVASVLLVPAVFPDESLRSWYKDHSEDMCRTAQTTHLTQRFVARVATTDLLD